MTAIVSALAYIEEQMTASLMLGILSLSPALLEILVTVAIFVAKMVIQWLGATVRFYMARKGPSKYQRKGYTSIRQYDSQLY